MEKIDSATVYCKTIGWMTGQVFGAYYVMCQANPKEENSLDLWEKDFRSFEEQASGFDIYTSIEDVIKGAKDAVMALCNDPGPALVAKTATDAFSNLQLNEEAKKEFVDGFKKGFDQDNLQLKESTKM